MRAPQKVDLKSAADEFKKLFLVSEAYEKVYLFDRELIRRTEASCLKFGRQSAQERWRAGHLVNEKVVPHIGLKTWAREYGVPYESARKAKYLAERVTLEEIKDKTITEAYEYAKIVQPRPATGHSKNKKVVEPTTAPNDAVVAEEPPQEAVSQKLPRRKPTAPEEKPPESEDDGQAPEAILLRWSLDSAHEQLTQFLDLLNGCTLTADERKQFRCQLLDIRHLADDALSAIKTDTPLVLPPICEPETELP